MSKVARNTNNSRVSYIDNLIKDTIHKHESRTKSMTKQQNQVRAKSSPKQVKHTEKTPIKTYDQPAESESKVNGRVRSPDERILSPQDNSDIKDVMTNSAEKSIKSVHSNSKKTISNDKANDGPQSNQIKMTPLVETRIKQVTNHQPLDLIAEYRNTITERYSKKMLQGSNSKSTSHLNKVNRSFYKTPTSRNEELQKSKIKTNNLNMSVNFDRSG